MGIRLQRAVLLAGRITTPTPMAVSPMRTRITIRRMRTRITRRASQTFRKLHTSSPQR
nr:MAG TPA: hypothetical protein [Caudoviricetes sp.]